MLAGPISDACCFVIYQSQFSLITLIGAALTPNIRLCYKSSRRATVFRFPPTMLGKLPPQREIERLLDLFHGNMDKAKEGELRPWFVVATTSSFGVGLTLSESTVIGLRYCDYPAGYGGRRSASPSPAGNRNNVTRSWLFKGNEREEIAHAGGHSGQKDPQSSNYRQRNLGQSCTPRRSV